MQLTNLESAFKILVVDDEPLMKSLILRSFKEQISNNQLDFLFAMNGKEALQIVQDNPDLGVILTDINMPEMDGLSLLAQLFKLNRLFRTIVISAYADMRNIRTAMNRGASEFITKPIDLQDLKDTVAKTVLEYVELKHGIMARQQILAISNELKIAHDIQQTFIPLTFNPFPKSRSVEMIGEMLPAKEIGGDFFDFIALDDHRLGFFIADVAGKGIPAALFMARSSTLMRGVAVAADSEGCDECMKTVNKILCDKNESCIFVTAFYGRLDIRTGELTYCNAGHNPPILFSEDKTIQYIGRNEGIALGADMVADTLLVENTLQLKKNDLLVLYTDGVTEATAMTTQEIYSEERLVKVIERTGQEPLSEILSAIKKDILEFSHNAPQSDDITIFLIRYLGSPLES